MDITLHKIPPQAIEAEEGLLSSILIDNSVLDDLIGVIEAWHFYKNAHQKIYQVIQDMFNDGTPIDIVTLAQELKDREQLELIGGATYLARLTTDVPVATNPHVYARYIKDKALKRKIIEISNSKISKCFDDTEDTDSIVDEYQKEVLELDKTKKMQVCTLSEGLVECVDRLEMLQDGGQVSGIKTDIKCIDRMSLGLQPSDLIILAARPGMGKSSLALNILDNIVMRGEAAAYFSLEMPRDQLINRQVSKHARVNGLKFRHGRFSNEEWKRITDAAGELDGKDLFIYDSSDMNILDIRRESRKIGKKKRLSVVAIDYLQLINSTYRVGRSRAEEVSEISRNLKNMAKELDVPVIALSQLNRKLEERINKRPRLSDLRESGSLEQDADVVLFLYRKSAYDSKAKPDDAGYGKTELDFAKHRNGPTGFVILEWEEKYTQFYDPAQDDIQF